MIPVKSDYYSIIDLNQSTLTLNEAKSNYLKFGACEEEMLQYVRPPKSSEKGRS